MNHLAVLQDKLLAHETGESSPIELDIIDNTVDMVDDIPNLTIVPFHNERAPDGDWMLEPLYRKEKDKTRLWCVYYNDEDHSLYFKHGFIGMGYKRQTNVHPIQLNTTGRDYTEQAFLEAKARYLVKCRKDLYMPQHASFDTQDVMGCMLAYKYKAGIIKKFPVFVDMKIDGWRLKARWNNDHVELKTRGGKEYHHLHELREEIQLFLSYLPAGTELDGEMWLCGYSRQKLQSILSTAKLRHELNDRICFYVFDVVEPNFMPINHRYEMLVKAYQQFTAETNVQRLFIVTKYLANSHEEIMQYHDWFVTEHSGEGAMVKKICSEDVWRKVQEREQLTKLEQKEYDESIYRPRRCNSMYKVKMFTDEEGIIIGFDQASGTQDGCITLHVRSKNGQEFSIGSFKGIELDERRALFAQGHLLIGRQLTYCYQDLSKDGKPLHPVGIGLRDII